MKLIKKLLKKIMVSIKIESIFIINKKNKKITGQSVNHRSARADLSGPRTIQSWSKKFIFLGREYYDPNLINFQIKRIDLINYGPFNIFK